MSGGESMRSRLPHVVFVLLVYVTVFVGIASAQGTSGDDSEGFALPNNRRIHVRVEFMAGYTHDEAQTELGLADQGRVGYAILTFAGDVNDRISYHVALNPVAETQPTLACGEPNYFYPNSVTTLGRGPNVACEEDGNQRVDMYKSVGLDNIIQQGP